MISTSPHESRQEHNPCNITGLLVIVMCQKHGIHRSQLIIVSILVCIHRRHVSFLIKEEVMEDTIIPVSWLYLTRVLRLWAQVLELLSALACSPVTNDKGTLPNSSTPQRRIQIYHSADVLVHCKFEIASFNAAVLVQELLIVMPQFSKCKNDF